MKEEDRPAASETIKGNTRSMINTKDLPAPMFTTGESVKQHYGSFVPTAKYATPQLESHKYGWRSKKPLEPAALRTNFGRVNARCVRVRACCDLQRIKDPRVP